MENDNKQIGPIFELPQGPKNGVLQVERKRQIGYLAQKTKKIENSINLVDISVVPREQY